MIKTTSHLLEQPAELLEVNQKKVLTELRDKLENLIQTASSNLPAPKTNFQKRYMDYKNANRDSQKEKEIYIYEELINKFTES